MTDQQTCIIENNYIEYYNSCPSIYAPRIKNFGGNNIASAFQLVNSGRGSHVPIFFLRDFFESHEYSKYLLHPELIASDRISNQQSDFSDKTHPTLYNGLWITNQENPRKIDGNLANFIEQAKKIPAFDAVIWTNISPQKLEELNPELKSNNIKVKSVADINTNYKELVDFVLSPAKYIQPGKGDLYNGVIIDVVKYLIAESEGGFIADLNFKFSNTFSLSEITKHDFIAPDKGGNFIENGFFYTKPHHIIFHDILNMISELLLSPNCALLEFRETMNKAFYGDSITNSFSMSPLAISYVKNNNKDGNVDVLTSIKCNDVKTIKIELEQEISNHAKNAEYLFSKDFDLVTMFTDSHLQVLSELTFDANCIDNSLVGSDNNLSVTWWGAGIV